jgi:hypothetical protein
MCEEKIFFQYRDCPTIINFVGQHFIFFVHELCKIQNSHQHYLNS